MFSGVSNKIPLRSELSRSQVKGEKKRRSEEPLDEEAVGGRVAHGDEPSPPPLRRSERDRFTGPPPAAPSQQLAQFVMDGLAAGDKEERKKETSEAQRPKSAASRRCCHSTSAGRKIQGPHAHTHAPKRRV